MFDYITLGYCIAREALATGELKALVKRQISWNRTVTPVEMDLSNPFSDDSMPANSDLCFTELNPDEIRTGKWNFSVQSRRAKALYKIKRGIRGFALVRSNTVIADVWCVFPQAGKPVSHPDLKMLGLTCGNCDVYAFDMLIDPSYRGKNLAISLQRHILRALKSKGFAKVYAAFYDDNLPALWMHRMLKYKELPKRKVSRFLVFTRSVSAEQLSPGTKKKVTNQLTRQ